MEWINQAIAFAIMGLVIWGVNQLISKSRGTGNTDPVAVDSKAQPSTEQKSQEPRRVGHLPERAGRFVSEHKWSLVLLVLLGVLLGVGTAIGSNNNAREQEMRWQCLQRIEYHGSSGYYLDDDRRFKTQDEALDYCLSALSNTVDFRPF